MTRKKRAWRRGKEPPPGNEKGAPPQKRPSVSNNSSGEHKAPARPSQAAIERARAAFAPLNPKGSAR